MKLQQLQGLVAVVEQGSIRAAARHLHLSQAAVTKSMRTLEEEAGVALLQRGSRGIALTAAGERLLERARLITRQVQLARDDLAQLAGQDAGSVRVGVTPVMTLTGLGEAFSWFRQRYAHVQVQLIEGLMARVLPRLREGTLDIAVVAADVGEIAPDEFHQRRLRRTRQRVVARAGHPLLRAAPPGLQAWGELEWVLTQPVAGGGLAHVEALFAQVGLLPPTRVVQCETLAALSLLRHADVVALMPEPLLACPEAHGIVAVESCPLQPLDLELLLLTRPDTPLTPAAEFFAHCLAQVSQA
jgi:DNA-binding transcriptional LysR family regulator